MVLRRRPVLSAAIPDGIIGRFSAGPPWSLAAGGMVKFKKSATGVEKGGDLSLLPCCEGLGTVNSKANVVYYCKLNLISTHCFYFFIQSFPLYKVANCQLAFNTENIESFTLMPDKF